MANDNPVKKDRLDKKYVGIIIKDNQPLSIRDDEGFQEFVEELNPFYELPSDKKVKELLVKGYNYCKQEIIRLLEQGVASCSLTLDLWTSRSRAGYLVILLLIASLLDPRCKSLNFANESQKNQTKALFREIYNEKRQELSTIQQQQSLSPDNTINSLLQDIFANRHRRERQDEIDEYMMIEEIDVSTCPFKWWASQESRFPILSQLAKKYLAIPATSAASERLFSDAGNVMTVKRTNLSPTTFEHLIFCKRNWHLIGRIFPE
ncbi:unnamed protein product [Rhizophagus irregularis]|nr:unnamed protein product [Rhizophagus irregularis]